MPHFESLQFLFFSGEWQDISAVESGLVRTKLELLEKEFDRPLEPLGRG